MLAARHFLHESDLKVAQDIIHSFVAKRLLLDSIRRSALSEIQSILEELDSEKLRVTLNEPVDAGLNTLLHIAAQEGCIDSAQELLDYGAQPELRNLRGDVPS